MNKSILLIRRKVGRSKKSFWRVSILIFTILSLAVASCAGCKAPTPESQLIDAIEHSDIERARNLIANGVDPNTTYHRNPGDSQNNSALQMAIADSGNQYEMVKLLLESGASANHRDSKGRLPLHVAAHRGEECKNAMETFKLLTSATTDIDEGDNAGESPLHYCAREGYIDFAMLLVSSGANVNVQSKYGETPAHLAASYRRTKLLEYLKKNGADFEIKNNLGESVYDVFK